MRSEVLLALITKAVEDYFSKFVEANAHIVKGPRGEAGRSGKDFVWEEHEETIREIVKENSLKFKDLSEEEVEALRGPRGHDGRHGKDGVDGKDAEFIFSDHATEIQEIISSEVKKLSPELKLKFTDLDLSEVEALRGPRGQRGKPGKSFDFEEHREYFESLKLTFKDLTEDEIQTLRLKFTDLTAEEINEIKLKFEDLTDDDKLSLRGPRGQRGKPGPQGDRGPQGDKGDKGLPGIRGLPGIHGRDGAPGADGRDGKDAPFITEIYFEEHPRDEMSLVAVLSDGTRIETNRIARPQKTSLVQMVVASGGGGSGGGTGDSAKTLQDSFTAGEPLSALKFVYVGAGGELFYGDKAAYPSAKVLGMNVNAVNTGETVSVVFAGKYVDASFTYPVGDTLFLTSGGSVSNIPPISGSITKVGYSLGPGSIFIKIEEPIILI